MISSADFSRMLILQNEIPLKEDEIITQIEEIDEGAFLLVDFACQVCVDADLD